MDFFFFLPTFSVELSRKGCCEKKEEAGEQKSATTLGNARDFGSPRAGRDLFFFSLFFYTALFFFFFGWSFISLGALCASFSTPRNTRGLPAKSTIIPQPRAVFTSGGLGQCQSVVRGENFIKRFE